VTVAGVRVARSAAIVQAPAVAFVNHVVGVAKANVTVLGTVPGNVANEMSGASVRVTFSGSEVELESIALVSHQVWVAVGSLALFETARFRNTSNPGKGCGDQSSRSKSSEDGREAHCELGTEEEARSSVLDC